MTPVGFEPTQLALMELESTPLDHSGKVSLLISALRFISLRSTKEKEKGRQAGRQALECIFAVDAWLNHGLNANHAARFGNHARAFQFAANQKHNEMYDLKSQWGTWCSGITSASHAEGPGFKSQCVHFPIFARCLIIMYGRRCHAKPSSRVSADISNP